jgi:hypothetical protein
MLAKLVALRSMTQKSMTQQPAPERHCTRDCDTDSQNKEDPTDRGAWHHQQHGDLRQLENPW